MKIDSFINLNRDYAIKSSILLLAPPAWGKSRLIEEIFLQNNVKIIFYSPLRALAIEVYNRFLKVFYNNNQNIFILNERSDSSLKDESSSFAQFLKCKDKALVVVTAETLFEINMDIINIDFNIPIITIFDEFHLIYRWGDDFRPLLFDKAIELVNISDTSFFMTATLEEKFETRFKYEFSSEIDFYFKVDLGNGTLKNNPQTTTTYPEILSKRIIQRRFLYEVIFNKKKNSGTVLLFCKYRREVDEYLQLCSGFGISAIGCKGGEAKKFQKELVKIEDSKSPLNAIIATSVLSHGVNLPEIRKVFLTYKVESKDFEIQMIGRGGRRGESFQLFQVGKNYLGILKIILFDLWVKLYLNYVRTIQSVKLL